MTGIFIITGKGGVGKTSVAAAHAVRSAAEGKNTLLVSADMAHNLGDIFQTRAGGHVQEIGPCLSVLELDPYLLMREEYPHINKSIANLSGSMGMAVGQIGDSYMIPGLENLFHFLKSATYTRAVHMTGSSWTAPPPARLFLFSNFRNCCPGMWKSFRQSAGL